MILLQVLLSQARCTTGYLVEYLILQELLQTLQALNSAAECVYVLAESESSKVLSDMDMFFAVKLTDN